VRDAIEHVEVDEDFAQHLADFGGYNYLGEPIFRMIWASAMRMETPGRTIYVEEEVPGMNQPCWVLQQWLPPEAYGPPELYEMLFKDEETGLLLTGPYPEFGRYEPIVMFKDARFDKALRRVVINTIPIDWDVLEFMMRVCLSAQELTDQQIQTLKRAEKDAIEKAKLQSMEDRLYDALPSFYGPTSYGGQRIKTSLIERESAKIEAMWGRLPKHIRKSPPRGFFQKN
jgi:hypothetical protein